MIRLIVFFSLLGSTSLAETIVAARTIPAQSVIGPADITILESDVQGSITEPDLVVGMEARVALYAGRPIRPGDVGLPAVVERNQIILLYYESNGLMISTEGRALGRAGPGERIRVMNLNSRSTVSARIGDDGAGYVSK